ncbi:MAG: hypothetical protein JWN14_1773, partial [Chthonomonadales bacterium]|nr:hypothetical protein [Chthonomonadales bacterium]
GVVQHLGCDRAADPVVQPCLTGVRILDHRAVVGDNRSLQSHLFDITQRGFVHTSGSDDDNDPFRNYGAHRGGVAIRDGMIRSEQGIIQIDGTETIGQRRHRQFLSLPADSRLNEGKIPQMTLCFLYQVKKEV